MHRQTVTGQAIVSPLSDSINSVVYARIVEAIQSTLRRAVDTLFQVAAEYHLSDAETKRAWQALLNRDYSNSAAWLTAKQLGVIVPEVSILDRVDDSIQHGVYVQRLAETTVIEIREAKVKTERAARGKTEWYEEGLDKVAGVA